MINTILARSFMGAALLTAPAFAGVIGNGPPNQTGGSDLNAFLEADNFTLANDATITQVKYWTIQDSIDSYAGSTSWAFWSDSAGAPGNVVASGTATASGVATGNTTFSLPEFAYTFSLSADLTAGAYWLVLHNGNPNLVPTSTVYWAWSADSGNSQSQEILQDTRLTQSTFFGNSSELAFEITTTETSSTTPEPGSVFLLVSGIGGCWLTLRRRNTV